jgi:hypothetical protein
MKYIAYRNHDMNRNGPVRVWLSRFASDEFVLVTREDFKVFFKVANDLGIKLVDQDEVDRLSDSNVPPAQRHLQ